MSFQGDLITAGINVSDRDLIKFLFPVQFQAGIANFIGRGKIFYVDATNGSTSNTGLTPTEALTTIDAAINKCTADRGDLIYLLPGHADRSCLGLI